MWMNSSYNLFSADSVPGTQLSGLLKLPNLILCEMGIIKPNVRRRKVRLEMFNNLLQSQPESRLPG